MEAKEMDRTTEMVKDAVLLGRVKSVLAESLNLDDSEVTLDAKLMSDLGAESIDMLDITFRLEREFGIKISRDELFPSGVFNEDPDCLADGRVTEKGLAKLREAVPHADFTAFAQDPVFANITDVFTVAALFRFVRSKVG